MNKASKYCLMTLAVLGTFAFGVVIGTWSSDSEDDSEFSSVYYETTTTYDDWRQVEYDRMERELEDLTEILFIKYTTETSACEDVRAKRLQAWGEPAIATDLYAHFLEWVEIYPQHIRLGFVVDEFVRNC